MTFKLRNRFSLFIILLVIVPQILAVIILTNFALDSLQAQSVNFQKEAAANVGHQVENFILDVERELILLDKISGLGKLNKEGQRKLLNSLLLSNPNYQELVLLDRGGREQIYLSRSVVVPESMFRFRDEENEYLFPIREKTTYFGPVHFDEVTNEPLAMIAVPLLEPLTGDVDFVLVANVRYKPIWDLLASLEFPEQFEVFVVDENNHVVAHPNPTVVLKGTQFDIPEKDGRGLGLFGLDSFIGSYNSKLGQQQLYVIAQQPASSALILAIQYLQVSTGVAIVSLIAAVVLVVLGIRQLIFPIESLASTAEAISTGELTLKANVRSHDEVGELALSFNRMTDQLVTMINTLEQRVEERTHDLNEVLNELQESEERYRVLAQNLPDSALFLYDHDLRFMIAEGPEIEAAGFLNEMIEGKTLWEFLPIELAQLVEPNMRRTLTGESFFVELPYEDRFYRFYNVPLRDNSGSVIRAMILATNITQLRKTEDALKDSQRRLNTALQATNVGVWEWNMSTNKAYWSDENYKIMGLEPGSIEARYENWAKCVHPDDLPAAEAKVLEAIKDDSDLDIEFRVVWPDGSIHWINQIGSLLMDEVTGEPLGLYGIQMDISERKHMEEQLYEEKERAETTLHSIGDAVITTDVHARVEYLNPVAENMTGWKKEEAVGQQLEEVFRIIEEGSRQPPINPVERCLKEGKVIGLDNNSILINRDGREFAIADSAAPIRNRKGAIVGVVLVFHDVTEARRLSQKLEYDARHDSLTGLVNRREFERRLERALVNVKKHGLSHTLCYMDLDQFKIVNDLAGHSAGDELLKQIAKMMGGLFRQRDTFARLGGDEFGLLLENCQLDQALVIANEILAKVRNFPFILAKHSFNIGVSIGIVPITIESESVTELLRQADIACYSAKDLGRDRFHIYQKEDSETTRWHNEMIQASRIQDGLIHDQFQLYCQPIARLTEDGPEVTHYEVLLRMKDSEEQVVLPRAFIPSAERYGLMPKIDRWVIRETFLKIAQYNVQGKLIAINLSGKSLEDETLLEFVLEQLEEFSISLEKICFEITETAAIQHLSKVQQFIQSLKEQGGKVALDDFGSGFSSFRYLKTLSVDYIKIDSEFIKDILSNPDSLMLVEIITLIAHKLGIQVVAENACTREIVNCLFEMGVDWAQGFGIGYPVPVEVAWGNNS
jgi:diguanylate cyclase (GGDEF)-like protein/PAS domain S-box-containing protein